LFENKIYFVTFLIKRYSAEPAKYPVAW